MDETIVIAGGVIAVTGALTLLWKSVVWARTLNDLVQHELRPNSGSSIKDEQRHQINLLKDIQEHMNEDRRINIEWQQGVMLTLGNHDGRLTGLEKRDEPRTHKR